MQEKVAGNNENVKNAGATRKAFFCDILLCSGIIRGRFARMLCTIKVRRWMLWTYVKFINPRVMLCPRCALDTTVHPRFLNQRQTYL